jgi:HK97 family phage prohead protease
METKAFPLSEVRAAGAKGEFEAIVSVFGNVDRVRDRVHEGAFTKAIAEQPPPPVVWFHQWRIPPIGETLDWGPTSKGLTVKGRLFVDEGDDHEYARMVYTAMKSREGRMPALRQFSFAYDVDEAEETFEKGARIRELKSLFPIHEVGPCLRGINEQTGLVEPPKAMPGYEAGFNGIYVPTSWVTNSTSDSFTFTVTKSTATEEPEPEPEPEPTPEPEPEEPTPPAEAKAIPAWRFPPQHATQTPVSSGGVER